VPGPRDPFTSAMFELARVRRNLGLDPDDPLPLDQALDVATRVRPTSTQGRTGHGPSRRQVLAGAGLAAAAAAVGPARPAAAGGVNRRKPKVVVVGAGLAGLTCTYRLHQHGVTAELFEARTQHVGGRCWTARDFTHGQVAEHGGEFVDTRHRQLRRLVHELGLSFTDLWAAWDARGKTHGLLVLDGAKRVGVYQDMDVVLRRLAKDARRVGDYHARKASAAAKRFDEMTMREWLDANVPGGSSSLLGQAMDIGQTGFWGLDPDDLSAITLIDAFITPYPGGPADERYHVKGGNDQVPRLLAHALPHGALHREAPLHTIFERSDGRFGLQFGNVSGTVVADHVVLCLPFTALRDVDYTGLRVSARKHRAIQHLGMGTNAKLLLQFDRPLDRFQRWNGSFKSDRLWADAWDSSLGQPGHAGLLTIFSGGRTGAGYPVSAPHGPAPQASVDEALAFLDRWLPGTRAGFNGRAWVDSWVDDPWTYGSYAAFRPRQWTSFWGELGRAEGRVHFAGEHTSTYSQGYLNGGVESGERAAREVLQTLAR